MAKVILENIYKSFPNTKTGNQTNILRNINLTVENGEFMVLVGPSGCGKSTMLRTIAGLETATGGNIWVGDRQVNNLPPKARDIAMVFQNYALYPHLKVYDNIAFGLRRNGKKKENWLQGIARQVGYKSPVEKIIENRVRQVADLLQIEGLLERMPKQLSGGQKQRVALGRAIARNPQVFLMDEPLSNLDAQLRAQTRSQIVKLQRQLGITTIYVTHDQTEAMTMGDRIAVMNRGEIQQIASPLELYNRPANRFVAEFIGSPPMNFINVELRSHLKILHPEFNFTLPDSWARDVKNYEGRSLCLGIRPENLHLSLSATKNIPVTIDLVEALGNDTYVFARINNYPESSLQIRIEPDRQVRVGDSLWLSINLEKIHLFDTDIGVSLHSNFDSVSTN